ncbi:MAG: hypothetical protein Q9N34_05320 [Aquificota bacterium]|nr:hypothetical protein [Aquificota bacterium]
MNTSWNKYEGRCDYTGKNVFYSFTRKSVKGASLQLGYNRAGAGTKQSKKISILIDDIAVATSTRDIDKEIVKVAEKANVKVYQGDEEDIIGRWYGASKSFGFDVIVRITSDCPVIDWKIIDKTISALLKENLDFASPSIPSRFVPHGLDVEVFTFELLDKVMKTFSKKDRIEKRILLFTYIEDAIIKSIKPEMDMPTRYKNNLRYGRGLCFNGNDI